MKRIRERHLVRVGAIRTCAFCFEDRPIVSVEKNATNGEAEYVCERCHDWLARDFAKSLGSARG